MPNRIQIELAILLALVVCAGAITVYQAGKHTELGNSSVESEAVSDIPADISREKIVQDKMPSIVFFRDIDNHNDEDIVTKIWDSQGNVYCTYDDTVTGLTYWELCERFEQGKLDDVLSLEKTCDMDELIEQYEMLKLVVQNEEFEIVAYNAYPDVLAERIDWYGVYYDENHELSIITLQRHHRRTTEYGNDENAVKICQWLDDGLQAEEIFYEMIFGKEFRPEAIE